MKKDFSLDLASVNEGLYDSLFIQKLENRLETDPLGVGGLVDLVVVTADGINFCPCYQGALFGCYERGK